MRIIEIALFIILIVVCLNILRFRDVRTFQGWLNPTASLKQELSFNDGHSLEITPEHLTISKNGKPIYQRPISPDESMSIFSKLMPDPKSGLKTQVALEHKKANQTYEYYIFKINDENIEAQIIPAGYSRWRIEQVDDHTTNIFASDWFSEWGARSVAPQLVLKWNGDNFVLDKKAMIAKQQSKEYLVPVEDAIKQEFSKYPDNSDKGLQELAPPELASEVFDLYYAGQGAEARHFFDRCWPTEKPHKEDYWSFLMQTMAKSTCWPEIKELNNLKADDRPLSKKGDPNR